MSSNDDRKKKLSVPSAILARSVMVLTDDEIARVSGAGSLNCTATSGPVSDNCATTTQECGPTSVPGCPGCHTP